MVEHEKSHGFMDLVKEGLGALAQTIAASIFPPMAGGAELVMKKVEESILRMEKRLLRKISSLFIIGFGGSLLVVSLFFFLRDFLGWSNALAAFSLGIIVFVTGLLLKVAESNE